MWYARYGHRCMEQFFNGSFEEAKYSTYADREVDNFQVEDGIFVMNI